MSQFEYRLSTLMSDSSQPSRLSNSQLHQRDADEAGEHTPFL